MGEHSQSLGVVLVADDDRDHADLLKTWLELRRYRCVVASDGPTAIDMARQGGPDVILLDLDMPGMNGYEVCGRLKADSVTRDTPIIFLTARTAVEAKIRGLAGGASDYVTKPFDLPEVVARVETALRTKAAMEHLKARQSRLEAEATTDGLTGLANRAYFNRRLGEEFASARRDGTPLACLMLDIDNFKLVNDHHGHIVGDRLLQGVGRLLADNVRADDVLARYGGEEFVILMPGQTIEAARILGERFRRIFEGHAFDAVGDGEPLSVTLSIGAAERRARHETAQALIEEADRALYRAKDEGRNRVVAAN